ncbi:hypothetical protein [Actinoplanes sp. DH11]|uniref:hypothetical protein n=1 Tax=Actinoplanes sp. DH11 TaxID=2857011 RepID=UPI001E62AE46|nr:hypothetical protein [Actinoplanes sp. DH11]
MASAARQDTAPPLPDGAQPPGRRLWGHVLRRCLLVPLVVFVPLLAAAPRGDHRFNIYWHGGMFRDDPLRIISHTVATGETYLRLGNFRPLGRMLEKALDTLVLLGAEQLHLSPAITLRLVSLGAAMVLTLAVVLFAESVLTRGRLFASPPSVVALLLPYAVAAGFVAAGRNSTTTLFGGLYLSTAALVLSVAAAACRLERMRWWHGVLAVTAGGALAIFNEPAYFAVPLATAAVLLRGRFVLGQSFRETLTSAGARFAALLWAGFLPVFAGIRRIIQGYCADGGCYHGSDIAVDARALVVLPARMLAWLPPAQWQAATERTGGTWAWGVLPVVTLVVLVVLAARTRKLSAWAARPGTGPLAGLAAAAAILLVFGAMPAALSVEVHTYYTGRALLEQGWRDSATTAPAGMLLAVVLLVLLSRARPVPSSRVRPVPSGDARPGLSSGGGRHATGLILGVLVLCATGSAAANRAYADVAAGWQSAQLDNRIALAIGAFEPGEAGNVRRCGLLAEALRSTEDRPLHQKRYTDSLDAAAQALAGVPFCQEPHE